MIKKLAVLIFLSFQLFNAGLLMAQDTAFFSSDPALFVAELEGLLRQVPARQRQPASALISNIRQDFNSGAIGSDRQQAMIETANRMQAFRLRPFPHFFTYFSAAMVCQAKFPDGVNFLAWNKSVLKLIGEDNERKLQNYLERSESFFREGTLYRSNAVQWQIFGGEWEMAADSLPVFSIRNASLRCYASRDSMSVHNVAGLFKPTSDAWIGSKGRINWERTGYPADQVFADFTDYSINLTNSFFAADSAIMHFPEYFNRPLPGSLSHRVVAGNSPMANSYPRFYSFNVFLEVRNIFQGMDYMGGFGLEGNRVLGFGKDRNNATITVRKDAEPIIKFTSQSFVIRHDRITSQRAAFCLYLEQDSIYHPGLQIRYLNSDNEFMLLRTGDGLALSPYFNSYHQLDMLFEALYWKLGADEMTFGAMRGMSRESEATFESANFFTTSRFNRIQGADANHPLIVISNYMQSVNSNIFYHEDLASHMNLSIEQVSAMLISLANQGFLQYSPDDGRAVVKDRIGHYIDAVNERSDYDVIRIQSKVDGLVNARLNLKTFDLDIYGVPELYLSNTQQVFVYPGNSHIVMKKGLDFLFQGRIHAGYFEFYAKECAFVYDEFKLNLTQIDSLSFNVPVEGDIARFREQLERVRTVISNIEGELLIDHPTNKSGRKNYPRYPIFDSKNDSYVYFDELHIQGGVYKRDSFYYHILPFTIDSLTNFTTSGMSFNGYLYSGGILPDIEEPLRVQPDYSLGFLKQFDSEGLPLYDGKATAFLELSISHQGLRGGGRMEYQSSILHSEDFVLHPDSMMATLSGFELVETIGTVSHPAVYATEVEQKWIHGDDRMILRSVKNIPFEMYDKQLVHTGTLTYSSSGLYGSGELSYEDAVFRSSGFHFEHNSFGATRSTLALTSPAFGLAFKASGYDFQFDLEIRQGSFNSAVKNSKLEFPLNQYVGYMESFRWEADYEEIFLSNEHLADEMFIPGSDLPEQFDPGNQPISFISVHQEQDSLRFSAGAARFDLREYFLDVQEVPFIEVADVAIFPVDGKVNIHRNAEMRPLQGAALLANTNTRYHRLYNVSAVINGRNDYSATGVYDYTDAFDKTQTIFFNRIAPDSLGNTFGLAHVSDLGFSLSPFFDFIGNIRFAAAKKEFYYDGGFRIRHECSETNPHWVKFNGEVDKQNVVLPVAQPPLDVHGEVLSSSLLFSLVNNKVYSGFLLGKQYPSDLQLFSAHGNIYFDPGEREYVISEAGPDNMDGMTSHLLKLNVDRCILSGEGEINFEQNLGRISMLNSGKFEHYMLPDSSAFNLFSVIDFFFDSDALGFLNQSILTSTLSGMDPGDPLFTNGLQYLLGESDAQRLLSELNLYGTFRKFPRELSQTMILSDIRMIWNHTTRSFTSTGPIGIVTLNSQLVNRYVEGHIELVRRRTGGDALSLYFQTSPTEWYFFTYSAGIMQAISSNEEFNSQVMNLRDDRRTLKSRGDEEPYQFIISTAQQRNAFLRRMRGN